MGGHSHGNNISRFGHHPFGWGARHELSRRVRVNDRLGRGSLVHMKSEKDLVRRASSGDRSAYGSLVERHWSRLVRLARSVVGEAEAEDAVQDGLIRGWRKLSQLADAEAFGSWISRVVVRICLRRARSRSIAFVPLETTPEPGFVADPAAGVDVARMLACLAPRQRAVMHLTVVEGMTDREIGVVMGITASSVRAHRHRARARLAQLMAQRSAA